MEAETNHALPPLFAPADEIAQFCSYIDSLPEGTVKRYTLWDLDNCLADDQWRVPRIDWQFKGNERYARYNTYARLDKAKNLDVFAAFQKVARPVFLSGRGEFLRRDSLDWMAEKLDLYVPPLLMLRPMDCDLRPAALKQEMLYRLFTILPRRHIIAAFDDMQPIVDMYQQNCVPAARLCIHEGYAAYGPGDLAPASQP